MADQFHISCLKKAKTVGFDMAVKKDLTSHQTLSKLRGREAKDGGREGVSWCGSDRLKEI